MSNDPYADFFSKARECGLFFDQTDSEYFSSEYSVEQLAAALEKYAERSRLSTIQFPSKYFGKLLESCSESNNNGNNNPHPPHPGKSHYPFTDDTGVTWHSYDYAEKNGRWYKKELIETQYGTDAIMRPCMRPPIETREEAERRVAEDKQLGIYQEAAQKLFDLAKRIAGKLDVKTETLQLPPPDPQPATVPWEVK
jgi:hypothetical protein